MREKRLITIFLALAMAAAAFAGGATVTGQVKTHTNANAGTGYAAECWDSGITTGPTAPNYLVGTGTLSSSPPNNISTRSDGKLCEAGTSSDGFYDPRHTKSVTIRVWEGADKAAVIAAKGYYGYGNYSIAGASAPPSYPVANVQCNYKADVPAGPTVAAGGYNLTWNDVQRQFLVAFTLSASRGTAYESEGVTYQIRVRKQAETTYAPERTHDGASWGITETSLTSPYFVGGGTYVAQAHATNAFGDIWGAETTFTIPTGGGGGVASVTYNLKKAEGGLGLNAIAAIHTVPFMVETTTGIDTVGKLVDAINAKSGSKNVVTFAWMEDGNATLQGWAISYDASGTATYTPTGSLTTGPDTLLVKDRIYQISVLQNVTVTFTSQ